MKLRRITCAPASPPSKKEAVTNIAELRHRYKYTSEGSQAVILGIHACQSLGHLYFAPEHYLLGLTHERASERLPRATQALAKLAVDPVDIWNYTVDAIGTGAYTHNRNGRDLGVTPGGELTSRYIAVSAHGCDIDSLDILRGLISSPENVGNLVLKSFGITDPHAI